MLTIFIFYTAKEKGKPEAVTFLDGNLTLAKLKNMYEI